MLQNSRIQKNEHLSFSAWDLLPLLTLACCVILYLVLTRTTPEISNRIVEFNKALLRGVVVAPIIWIAFTILLFIAKLPEYKPSLRGIITSGSLLFGLGLALEPIFGMLAFVLGFAVFMFVIIASIITTSKSTYYKLQEVAEEDPTNQAEFWKGGDILYFNKNDKRLFVPKRYQDIDNGLTMNYGHKKIWGIFLIFPLALFTINVLITIILR